MMEEQQPADLRSLVGEIDIVYKRKGAAKAADRPQISCSKDAYDLLLACWNGDKLELLEEFKVLLLNRANRVLHLFEVSSGGLTGTVADPRLILVAALKAAACTMVLAHNHPSGNRKPSRQDEELTRKIKQACGCLDIKLLDHLVITADGYYSFADEGLL